MDRRLSSSMPLLNMPLSYVSIKNPANIGRGRMAHRRYYINGVGPTRLVGLSPTHRPPQRLILCTPHGTYEKETRSFSTVELSRSGVYRSREDLRDARAERRAASYDDVYRSTHTSCWDSSRFSESGVSFNCSASHTEDGSHAGGEEDAVSQSSFGSSSAFCEITCDSELDRPDSDCVSVPGSERSRSTTQHRSTPYTASKTSHRDATTHNVESDTSSVKSGEFFHSTPTKLGSRSLSIFPADDDQQLDKDLPTSPHPTSPRTRRQTRDEQKTENSSPRSPKPPDSVRDSVKKSREMFFSLLQDCSKLDDLSSGGSIETWVSTGHMPNWMKDLSTSLQRQQQQQNQQHSDPNLPSPPPLATGARVSVRERVKALENGCGGADGKNTDEGLHIKKTDAENSVDLAETGDALFSCSVKQPPNGSCFLLEENGAFGAPHYSASQIGPPHVGVGGSCGGYQIGKFGTGTHIAGTARSGKVSQGEKEENSGETESTGVGLPTSARTARVKISQRFSDNNKCAYNEEDGGDIVPACNSGVILPAHDAGLIHNSGVISASHNGINIAVNDSGGSVLTSRNIGLILAFRDSSGPTSASIYEHTSDEIHNRCVATVGGKPAFATHRTDLTVEGAADRGYSTDDPSTFRHSPVFTADPLTKTWRACQGEQDEGAIARGGRGREGEVVGKEVYSTLSHELSAETDRGLTSYTSPRDKNSIYPEGTEACNERSNQLLTEAGENRTARSSLHDENNRFFDSPCTSKPPPTPTSTQLELHDPLVTPPPVLSLSMSRAGRSEFVSVQQDDGTWRTVAAADYFDTKDCYIDGNERNEPVVNSRLASLTPADSDVRIREVKRTHTRHVHRTTHQQIVTTHRTITTQGDSTHHGLSDSYASLAPCDGGDIVTDNIVSTMVREKDSSDSREEFLTQDRLSLSHNSSGGSDGNRPVASLAAHDALPPGVNAATATAQPLSHGQQQHYVTTRNGNTGQVSMNASTTKFSLLDSLEEQLSRLSSDDATLNDSFGHGGKMSQVRGYRDHAEASLPHAEQIASALIQGEIGGRNRVRGTGSVFITLDKSRQETSAIQILSSPWRELFSEDEGREQHRGSDRSSSPTEQGDKIVWRRPASSSSELDESDGNYSAISTTESSHYPNTPSESEYPPSEGPEDYDNVTSYDDVNSFHDFVSGLHKQSTSDQRHSPDFIMGLPLRSPVIQETILEADDESESADEANTTLGSYKSSLHFCVSEVQPQSTPLPAPASSQVPQIRLWGCDQNDTTWSSGGKTTVSPRSPNHSDRNDCYRSDFDSIEKLASAENRNGCNSHRSAHVNALQDLSDKLSSISSTYDTNDRVSSMSDVSFEVDRNLSHTLDSHHMDELDASLARLSSSGSPVPSDVSEGSMYYSIGFAEIKKVPEVASDSRTKSSESKSQLRRNLASTFKAITESDWIVEKQLQFERLLADLERQSRPQTHVMFDEMCHLETQQRGCDDVCASDDMYRAFTREDLEKRQNHICPIIDDQLMPVFRFKRFLNKKHNSRMKDKLQFRIVHKLGRLAESPTHGLTSHTDVSSLTEMDIRLRQKPYERIGSKASQRLSSDVFTDDGDVKKSFSDSAYSTMSSVSSRNWSDFDSLASVSSSRGDASSLSVDSSLDGDKLSALSDVFEQLDVCEGQIDQALLDRLRAGHYCVTTSRKPRYSQY